MVPGSIPGGITGFFSDIFPSDRTMALGLTQLLVKTSTRNIPGGKGGLCVRLTTSPPSRAECHEIREPKPPGTLWAILGLLQDCFTSLQINMKHQHFDMVGSQFHSTELQNRSLSSLFFYSWQRWTSFQNLMQTNTSYVPQFDNNTFFFLSFFSGILGSHSSAYPSIGSRSLLWNTHKSLSYYMTL